MKSISVIVPTYNSIKFVHRLFSTLMPLLNYSSIEVLFIDDGSSDSTFDLLSSWALNYQNVYAFKKTNGGVSSSRNFGISRAKGEWIYFVDSDDEVDFNNFINIIKYLSSEIDLLQFSYTKLEDDRSQFISLRQLNKVTLNHYNLKNFRNSVWCYIFRRQVILDNNLQFNVSYKYAEDMDFILRYMNFMNGKITCLNVSGYNYIIRKGSVMSMDFDMLKILQHWSVVENILTDSIIPFISFRANCNLLKFTIYRIYNSHYTENELKNLQKKYRKLLFVNKMFFLYSCLNILLFFALFSIKGSVKFVNFLKKYL
ncbi:glycosyltransferase family 2 protein [Segatella bryantii]|uniref:glycosyltransferase family 2 protein n=1 Tax=Segatella bryantii TaxID=77095 RepID=UPI00241E6C00|nr:glycosyltransferase family A protein [Segatella bryantii]